MWYLIPIAILGWLAGILINYLADELPVYRRLIKPVCQKCSFEIPFANYFIWPRQCPHCGARRTLRSWVVELLAILCSVWLWFNGPNTRVGFAAGMLLLTYFGVVVIIDLEHHLILHPVSLFGAALGGVVGFWLHGFWVTILGGLAGFIIMLGFYYLGILVLKLIARRRGENLEEEEALGFGDVNLSGVLGLLLGWPGILAGLTLAVLLGGVISLFLLVAMVVRRKYQTFTAIPYGPFLVAAAIILLFFNTWILSNL